MSPEPARRRVFAMPARCKPCFALTRPLLVLVFCASISDARPNIILMMADDFGVECVGAYGGVSYQTGAIDSLAARGLLFSNAYWQPLCTHSRLQLMTGLYNDRNYAGWRQYPVVPTRTFAHELTGYRTAIVGKWQFQGAGPLEAGFHEWCITDEFIGPRYSSPTFVIGDVGSTSSAVDFPGGYGPHVMRDYASQFIATAPEPWCLYYSCVLPHYPWGPVPGMPEYDPDFVPDVGDKGDPAYFGVMVEELNKSVRAVIRLLNQTDQRRNTIVIFCGDNGTPREMASQLATGEFFKGGKGLPTDAGTHVPLIVSWPGTLPQGETSDRITASVDVLPTLLEIASLPVPNGLDGRSFLSQPRFRIYSYYPRRVGDGLIVSARQKRYRLYSDGRFIDTINDPSEKSPLIELDDNQAERKAGLQKLLDSRQHGDPIQNYLLQ